MSRHCSSYGAYLNSSRLSRTHCVKTPSTTASVDCDQASHIDGSVFRVFLWFSQLQHHCTIFALHFANDFTTTEANSSHVGGGRICSFWTRRLHGAKLKIALKCLNSFVRGCSFSLFCRYARQYTAQCEKTCHVVQDVRHLMSFQNILFTQDSYLQVLSEGLCMGLSFLSPSLNNHNKLCCKLRLPQP